MAERTPLYVRLPSAQAERLDRAAFELKASKQDIVSGLIARYVDPGSTDRLRRVVIEAEDAPMATGRHTFTPAAGAEEVLTLDQLAELLQVDVDAVRELAEARQIPARRIADDWRFARSAILRWLAGDPDSPPLGF
jgi:excisionase family DNA binding protein